MCEECRQARLAARREKHRDLLRERHLFTKYGLTVADYDAMYAAQNGRCAICGGPPSESFRYFSVDHNHETGEVRALLCMRCNVGLSYIESPLLDKALNYIAEHAS